MEFQKERCFTALNADELKVGSKVIAADNLTTLKENLSDLRLLKVVERVESEGWANRFMCDDGFSYSLAYLVEEPEELAKKNSILNSQLTEAKYIIRNLLRVTYGDWNYSLDWKIKAEQFLSSEVEE